MKFQEIPETVSAVQFFNPNHPEYNLDETPITKEVFEGTCLYCEIDIGEIFLNHAKLDDDNNPTYCIKLKEGEFCILDDGDWILISNRGKIEIVCNEYFVNNYKEIE